MGGCNPTLKVPVFLGKLEEMREGLWFVRVFLSNDSGRVPMFASEILYDNYLDQQLLIITI